MFFNLMHCIKILYITYKNRLRRSRSWSPGACAQPTALRQFLLHPNTQWSSWGEMNLYKKAHVQNDPLQNDPLQKCPSTK